MKIKINFLHQIRKPKLSDIELISIDLTSKYMSIDLEYQLFWVLPKYLSQCIERSVYNRRKKGLFYHLEQLGKQIASLLTVSNYYIVYSMTLEVCKLSRSSLCHICKENPCTDPDKGYLSIDYQKNLFFSNKIKPEIPIRRNQHN